MERRHFDYDPLTGAVETFYFDHATDEFTIERVEDVTKFVDTTKYLQNNVEGGWKGDWHHVAAIPNTLLPSLEKLGIMSSGGRILDKKKLKAWLNDRDNRVFRTKLGEI
jgi:hypothetical protein